MIGKLRGIIEHVDEDSVILDVNGVGYVVFVSGRLAQSLHARSEPISLFIHTHVREDHIHLYGFETQAEQAMFLTLITVQGVGAKMGLAILSVFEASDIGNIILAQDKDSLTRVSGVGKRIAERIVTELKNKLPSFEAVMSAPAAASSSSAPSDGGGDIMDAVSALEHLGYARVDAMQATKAAQGQGADTLDEMIRIALKALSG